MHPSKYGGFWVRFLAALIDYVILSFICFILAVILIVAIVFIVGSDSFLSDPSTFSSVNLIQNNRLPEGAETTISIFAILFNIVVMVIFWLYEALFVSSYKQATPGKLALRLKVTDMEGNKLTFGRATGRYFGKYLSAFILYIGFIVAAFTEKKQALHDMIASTVVMNNDYLMWEKYEKQNQQMPERVVYVPVNQTPPPINQVPSDNIVPPEPEDNIRASAYLEEEENEIRREEENNPPAQEPPDTDNPDAKSSDNEEDKQF